MEPGLPLDRGAAIALVEDSDEQAQLIAAMLAAAGFDVRHYDSVERFELDESLGFAALVLDWELPAESGIDLLKRMRNGCGGGLPVLMLTARGDEADVVAALDAGADDFLTKPARASELVARLRALLRRAAPRIDAVDTAPYRFDDGARVVIRAGDLVELTPREFDLARHFFSRPGSLVPRRELEEGVLKIDNKVISRALDTHVSRIRRKLALDGSLGWKLEGVYQRGYRLTRG